MKKVGIDPNYCNVSLLYKVRNICFWWSWLLLWNYLRKTFWSSDNQKLKRQLATIEIIITLPTFLHRTIQPRLICSKITTQFTLFGQIHSSVTKLHLLQVDWQSGSSRHCLGGVDMFDAVQSLKRQMFHLQKLRYSRQEIQWAVENTFPKEQGMVVVSNNYMKVTSTSFKDE